jgi:hypothetical protein
MTDDGEFQALTTRALGRSLGASGDGRDALRPGLRLAASA